MKWISIGRNQLIVLAVCLWWTLEGMVTAGQLLTMQFGDGAITVPTALRRGLASAWLWIPCSLFLLWLVEHFPIERATLWRSLVVLAVAVLAVVLFRALVIYEFNGFLGWYEQLPPFREVLLTSVFNNFLLSWLNIGVGHALLFAQRAYERQRQAEQLQARLVETRLQALRAQLDPHFLFNALNSIAEMVHRDAAAADRMLVGLGSLIGSFFGAALIWGLPIIIRATPEVFGLTVRAATVEHLQFMIVGALIIIFLIVEPHGLARLWQIAKQKLRVWPYPY